MTFISKGFTRTAVLLLYANSVNLFFLLAHLTLVVVLRPVIVYEYFLIAIFIVLRFRPLVTWFFWFVILTVDILNSISTVFLFKLPEFLNNLEFSLHYSFSLTQYLLLFLFISYLYANFWLIKNLSRIIIERRRATIGFFICCICVVGILDYLNGSSRLARHRKQFALTDLNIGGSTMNLTAIMLSDFAFEAKKPSRIARSVTYQTFAEDSVGNQLLILIESWGLPIDEGDRAKITTLISKRAYQSGWSAQIGSTVFEGSTTSAELRELLSVSGNFRYLLNADSAKMMESIFSIKKKQGFTTMAVHSFSGRMFWRVGWWKNLGIDSVFFLEDVVKRKKLKVQSLNYSTPFASLNDEDSYSFITRVSAPQSRKRFVYFLTENSHLPFRQGKIKDTGISQFENKLSEEGNNQLARIQELLFFFMESKLSKEWSKILIVGDHVPPFTNNADRHFYSPTCVPYLILTRN